jgi:hypothetical protein
VVTSGESAQIRLSTDQTNIKAEPSAVAHIAVEILDKELRFHLNRRAILFKIIDEDCPAGSQTKRSIF